MYARTEYRDVEPKCYEYDHIEKVVSKIKETFPDYFERFLETEGGVGITSKDFAQLQAHFGVKPSKDSSKKDNSEKYKRIIAECYDEFEKDRKAYLDIFDLESLEEYEVDAYTFKSDVLKTKCPIIRKTLNSKNAKELDKYRFEFSVADADYLLQVVTSLCETAQDYVENIYDPKGYEAITDYKELQMEPFDSEECTAYGVIGGGIKTIMLHKYNPEVFSSRSRNALWALWYLTDKETFELRMDSEFLMIDLKKTITQQNYFYPYELFHYYAFVIYKLLNEKAKELDVALDPEYRYVIVDRFFDFVADEHASAISEFLSQIKDNEGAANA